MAAFARARPCCSGLRASLICCPAWQLVVVAVCQLPIKTTIIINLAVFTEVDLFALNFYLDRVVSINHSGIRKLETLTGLPDGADRICLRCLILARYRSVTDGWTNGRICYSILYSDCRRASVARCKNAKMASSSDTGIQFSTRYRKYFDSESALGSKTDALKLNAGNMGECSMLSSNSFRDMRGSQIESKRRCAASPHTPLVEKFSFPKSGIVPP